MTATTATTAGYWKVCALKVRARKRELGRAVTNTAIAAAVEAASGKTTTRQLVEAWFAGRREPYVSQLVALCRKLEMDLADVIRGQSASTLVHAAPSQRTVRQLIKDKTGRSIVRTKDELRA